MVTRCKLTEPPTLEIAAPTSQVLLVKATDSSSSAPSFLIAPPSTINVPLQRFPEILALLIFKEPALRNAAAYSATLSSTWIDLPSKALPLATAAIPPDHSPPPPLGMRAPRKVNPTVSSRAKFSPSPTENKRALAEGMTIGWSKLDRAFPASSLAPHNRNWPLTFSSPAVIA